MAQTPKKTYSRPDPKAWENMEELISAGTKGWNPIQRLPAIIAEVFDWAKEFTFGFFSEDDIAEARSYGWEHVRSENFDTSDFNRTVGLRFGLDDESGLLKFRKNYLMMMPKEYRARQIARRNQDYEDSVARTLRDNAYAHPEDPRQAEVRKFSEELSSGETFILKGRGTPEDVEKDERAGSPE